MILRSLEKNAVARPLFVFLRIQLAFVFGLIALAALLAYLFPVFFPAGPYGALLTGSLLSAHQTAMATRESFARHFGRAPTQSEYWRFVLVSTAVVSFILAGAAVFVPGISNREQGLLLQTAAASLLYFTAVTFGYSLRPRHLHRMWLKQQASSPARGRDSGPAERL